MAKTESLSGFLSSKIDDACIARMKYSFGGTFVFSMAANAFAYLNFYPQHDAVNHALSFASTWEVQLGRFLLPLFGKIRGNITVPWVIGLLSMLFIGTAVYLVTDILKIDNPALIVLSAGFLSANITVTEMSSVFLFVEDAYLLSMLLACLGVWIISSDKATPPRVLLSSLCFFLSFGLYQSSCTTALVLYVFLVFQDCIAEPDHLLRRCFPKWLIYCLSLGIGTALYVVFYKFSLWYYDTTPASSYNSLSNLTTLSATELLAHFRNGYSQFISFFFKNCYVGTASTYCNIVLAVLLLIYLGRQLITKKVHVINWIIAIACIAVLPGFCLLMGIFMGEDSIYFLTAYALFLLYPAALSGVSAWNKKTRCLAVALSAVILFQNIVYSNDAYTVQKVLYDRALSNVTRILDDIEADPDYVNGETPVVIVGVLSGNNGSLETLTSKYSELSGFMKSSVTYAQTFGSFAYLLGSSFNRETDSDILTYYSELEEVQAMATYPKDGYYQMIDGYMVVKLSE
ncbi:MAG: glucosyltransferase domain-containing protein [Clostridiales bacterium]|nr:glucosyltransferase domain-containing protein [Clostridiales bacterium]